MASPSLVSRSDVESVTGQALDSYSASTPQRDGLLPRSDRGVEGAISRSGVMGLVEDWGWPEAFDDEIDAKEQLPKELRDCCDGLRRGASPDYGKHHGDP